MKIKSTALLLGVLTSIGLCGLAWAPDSKPASAAQAPQSGTGNNAEAEKAGTAVVATAPANPNPYKPSTDKDESAACKQNLEKLNAAVEAYRKDHQDVPNWLSELVPQYLADTNVLICPVTTRTGQQSPFGVLDPKISCSYLYEFSPTPIPEVVKGAWPGAAMTMREWKRQQMKLVGPEVPLVRCLLHDPALNLSMGGKVYESPVLWELNYLARLTPQPHEEQTGRRQCDRTVV